MSFVFLTFLGKSSYTEGSARLLARFDKLRQDFKDMKGLYIYLFRLVILRLHSKVFKQFHVFFSPTAELGLPIQKRVSNDPPAGLIFLNYLNSWYIIISF